MTTNFDFTKEELKLLQYCCSFTNMNHAWETEDEQVLVVTLFNRFYNELLKQEKEAK